MCLFENEFHAHEKGFVELYYDRCKTAFDEGNIMNLPIRFSKSANAQHVNCDNTPFACNYCGHNGARYIVYNPELIELYDITKEEQYAFIAHELGHLFIYHNNLQENDALSNEIKADEFATKLGFARPLLSGLQKIIELNPAEITQRISRLQEQINTNRNSYEND